MIHLTDEQLEEVLQGGSGAEPAHVVECPLCRDRLAERKALRERLRSAFSAVRAGEDFVRRLRRSTAWSQAALEAPARRRGGLRSILRRAWPGVAAAAALVLAIGLVLYLAEPHPAAAAQAELFGIHERNLSYHDDFYVDAAPEGLAAYLKGRLGFTPAMPRLGQGMSIRGCCVSHFRGRIVGSYVVDTPRGFISIIVVPDRPDAMGMTRESPREDDIFWTGSFAKRNIVAVWKDNYSYCAVGQVSHVVLTDLLRNLMEK